MPNLTKYSLDHEVRSSFEMGQLIPFLCQEVVPGDKYRVQSSTLVRLQPMLSPLMHRLDYFQRYYYVPYRLLIPNYEQLLTDPDSSQVVPSMDKYLDYHSSTFNDLFKEKPLLEYFGLATSDGDSNPTKVLRDINATPLLAYYLIYNHYYMRSDLDKRYVDQLRPEHFASASIRPYIGNVMHVNEGLDYFTSAKTSTQYGNMVQLDMDGNNTITVPEMRLAERLQSFRERLLRVGGKYVNYIKEFFGVEPLDARVQIPKYLGGDSYVLNVSDVDQTAPSELGAVGESYGKSVSVNRTGQIQYDVYEHGLIIGLHFVRPRPSNIGGCPKLFTRRNYFDFFNPHFSALGYQEIESRELDLNRPSDVPFGYVPRYDDYRYGNDIVSGDFRRSLSYWHMSRDISKENLSVDFVSCRPDNRIFSFRKEPLYLHRFVGRVSNIVLNPNENPSYPSTENARVKVFGLCWVPKGFIFKDRVLKVVNKFGGRVTIDHFKEVSYDLEITSLDLVSDDTKSGEMISYESTAVVEDGISTSITGIYVNHDGSRDRIITSYKELVFKVTLDERNVRMSDILTFSFEGSSYPLMFDSKRLQVSDEKLKSFFLFVGYGKPRFVDRVLDSAVDNHVLSVTYNNVDVLRPLARYDGNVLR